jgi:hypothetical protein
MKQKIKHVETHKYEFSKYPRTLFEAFKTSEYATEKKQTSILEVVFWLCVVAVGIAYFAGVLVGLMR